MNETSKAIGRDFNFSFSGEAGIKLSPFGAGYVKGRDMYIRIPLVVQAEYKNQLTADKINQLVVTMLREQYPQCRIVAMHESDGTPIYGVVKDMGLFPTVILRYVVSVFFEARVTSKIIHYAEKAVS